MSGRRLVTVELDGRATELIDQMVAEKRFADDADVLRYAMLLFDEWVRDGEQPDDLDDEELRQLWAEAEASGPPLAGNFDLDDIKRRNAPRLGQLHAAAE